MSGLLRRALLLAALHLTLPAPAAGASPFGDPRISDLVPWGGQLGTEVTLRLAGDRLTDAEALVLSAPGLEVLELKAGEQRVLEVRLAIAADCPPGLHPLRVRTRTGISNLLLFSVSPLPIVEEVEPNDGREAPQEIALDVTVHGVTRNEDADWYAFEGKAGERVTAEIEGLRLGGYPFDPAIALVDSRGFELDSCDDAPLLRLDASVSAVLPADGRYLVRVRESAYRGDDRARYRLHVGRFPRPTSCLPLGGAPGETLELTTLGDVTGEATQTVTLPTDPTPLSALQGWCAPALFAVLPSDATGTAPSPIWVRLSTKPNVSSTEPDDDRSKATPFEVPAALNGALEGPGDQDHFVVEMKKGDTLRFVSWSRRLRSALDPVLILREPGGRYLKGNDDDKGMPDSLLEYKAAADGPHVLEVRDHLGRGGPAFTYRIEVDRPTPDLHLEAPRQRTAFDVPRGGRSIVPLEAVREDFGGPLRVELLDLPAGVTAEVPEIADGVSNVPVLLVAAADAPLAHSLADVRARHSDEGRGIQGGYRQEVELVLGRNNTVHWACTSERLPIAVTEPAPFTLELVAPAVPLVQNGSTNLVVQASRAEGFDGPIKLTVPFVPPGLGVRQGVRIEKGQTEAQIPINANSRARVGEWSLVVEGEVDPGGGLRRAASSFVPLHVAPPFVTFSPQGVAVQRGSEGTMLIEWSKGEGFQGKATVRLGGMPRGIAAEPVELTADSGELLIPLAAGDDSPIGLHKSLFATAVFECEGGPVVHRLPAGELRVEKPRAEPVAAAPAPAKPAEAAAKTEPKQRPPTRLEALRMEHEARKAAERAAESGETETADARSGEAGDPGEAATGGQR